jgi:TonB family protein
MKSIGYILFIATAVIIASCNNPVQKTNATLEPDKTMAIEKHLKTISADTLALDKNKKVFKPTAYVKKSVAKSNPSVTSGKCPGMSDFYKLNQKTPQVFNIPIDKDTILICNEGTSIRIPAYSFIDENSSKEIKGRVQVSVQEFYNLSDMIMANLSTISGNKILETGGMINITASFDNRNCILKNGKEIEIGFPYKEKKTDMQLFSGKRLSDNQIDWQLKEQTPDTSVIFSVVDEMPEFPGGDAKRIEFLVNNIKYPQLAKETGVQGTVYVCFTISETGRVRDIILLRGIHPLIDQAAIDLVKNMPVWKPGKLHGKNVKVSFNMPIRFSLGGDYISNDKEFAKDFEQKMNADNLKDADLSEVSRYLFSTSNLGYLNCDRFFSKSANKINLLVREDSIGANGSIKLIFDNMNAIYDGNSSMNQFQFANVPEGEPITIVAIKYKNGVPCLAIRKTTISAKPITDLSFQAMTMESLQSEMKKLDRLN